MSDSEFRWTWSKGKQGLVTVFLPDGKVLQERIHPKESEPTHEQLGKLSPAIYQRLLSAAEPCFDATPAEGAAETVELSLGERTTGPQRVKSLSPAMANLRREVRAAREKAAGGFFAWNSLGGRLAFLFGFIVVLFSYWIVRDWRYADALQVAGERADAVVVRQEGDNVKNCALVLNVPGHGETTVKDYLSLENWKAAPPGSTVRVWVDPKTGHTYLEKDMLRWQQDKKLIPLLPLSFAAVGFIACYSSQRYRVGVYPDGKEYLTRGDVVSCDDKDALINRTDYQMAKMFYLFGKR